MLIGVFLSVAGCVVPQPESLQTVAAFEIPVPTRTDRAELLALVRQEAEAQGLRFYAASEEELRETAEVIPQSKRTISAAAWRGAGKGIPEITITDGHDHLGLAWITFAKGEDVAQASRFRERLMGRILLRWPETTPLPVMPAGNIPLPHQLIKTPNGYKLDPAYASSFGVTTSSPLVFEPEAG
ncbi:MAG: hypothetical protein KKF88_10055 [Alphaproteobacteria bacterium]|nr:hypothetical protein [Alphaproteobacteria bacterium]